MTARFALVDAVDVTGRPVALHGLSHDRVYACATRILGQNALCSVATVASDALAHIHTAHFCYTAELELYFLSHPGALHSRNLCANSSAAITVVSSAQAWGGDDEGLQLFGTCAQVQEDEAVVAARVYGERFPAYFDWLNNLDLASGAHAYRFYKFEARDLKLLCEREYGPAIFVRAVIDRSSSRERRGARVARRRLRENP